MQFDTIIFDWDGTIGMTLHLWVEGYRHALADQNHALSDTEIIDNLFSEHEKAELKYPGVAFPNLVRKARDFVHDNLPTLQIYPEARDTLETLARRGVKMALVSSSPRILIDTALHHLEMKPLFEYVLAGDEVRERKPHPEAFLTTLQAIKSDPQRTLIVGDTITDIQAGKAAKTQTCLFVPEQNLPFYDFDLLHTSDPDHSITALNHLL